MKRALTGIQPSGEQHLGNWLGAISPGIALQESHETFYFIASYHALTTSKDPKILRERILDAAMTWLAFGLDPAKTAIWAQHDTPEVTEMPWLLSCMCSKGLLDKAHAFKDAVAKGKKQISAGLYTYPVLMASDILAFHSNVVPVGKDQKQHLEITRDIAIKFNHTYGEILIVPEPDIEEKTMLVPGVDGQKMSKSYGNTIPIFADDNKLKNPLKLNEMMICRGIYKRNPIKPGIKFLNNVDSLFCYTKISNIGNKQEVKHIWYFENKEMTTVSYNIKTSYNYRSWSK